MITYQLSGGIFVGGKGFREEGTRIKFQELSSQISDANFIISKSKKSVAVFVAIVVNPRLVRFSFVFFLSCLIKEMRNKWVILAEVELKNMGTIQKCNPNKI